MAKVRVLDAAVVDRIAAGEVVERPASVVKELIENSLDAEATRVEVRVEGGGARLVEVVDDGHGMDRADVELAFAQHATSKISRVEDLDAIATLGFRGEALASIASVSHVDLSSGRGEGPGVRTQIEAGQVRSTEPVAWPRGTSVRVADLFFNTPARRKHLRRQSTELGHVAHTVLDYALARTDVYFSLTHGRRTLVSAPPVVTLAERVHQVLGEEPAAHWLTVEHQAGTLKVSGGVTAPEHQRPNRRQIRWYVNGRPVSDYRLSHALVSAYETLLDSGRFPLAALFIELPVTEVDVNVHPRKAEVRFTQAGQVYRAVRATVRSSLASHLPPPTIHARPDVGESRSVGPASGAVAQFGLADGYDQGVSPQGEARHASLPLRDWVVSERTGPDAAEELEERDSAAIDRGAAVRPDDSGIVGTGGVIQPLAQYANTYILAADEEGLLIIDQHVAHERVLYEQILGQMHSQRVEAQHLLVPETFELTADEAAIVEDQAELLERLGFVLEAFGGNSWALRTAPAVLEGRHLVVTLRSLLESLDAGQGPEAVEGAQHRAAATISCHAAVRANHPLTREEMVHLVNELGRCSAPTRCPHGRPTLLRVDHTELEKRLGRR